MSNYTQVERNGLFELTDAARAELTSSKYYNEDLAPTSVSQRTWTTYNITMLWVGMSICVPSLSLATGLVQSGISPWLAVINVTLGNLIILVPIQLNSHIGTKYGIPFPLFARLTFGSVGAQIPSLLRALVATGWCSVQSWVGGGAVAAIIGCFAPKFSDTTWTINLPSWGGMQTAMAGQFIGFILYMLFTLWVAYNGIENIKWVQNIGSPILIVLMIALCAWSVKVGSNAGFSFGDIMGQGNNEAALAGNGGFALVFLSGLMGNIAFWATVALNIPDFSRYAKSQKVQIAGQFLGMPAPMFFCAFTGAVYAQAATLANTAKGLTEGMPGYKNPFDVITVLYGMQSKIIVIIVAIGVVMATITTCVAANVVAPANGISNISPRKISYRKGVVISILLSFFIFQAWWIYGTGGAYFNWLNIYGTLLAPVAAIFIADYFVVRKKRIEVAGLFKGPEGRYWYSGGWNIMAVLTWIISFALPLIVQLPTVLGAQVNFGAFGTFMSEWNYIVGFLIGFFLYIPLMKASKAGKASLVTEEEHESFTERASN